ncbi:MAG: hypothetical protein MZV64_74170 [Ignavibacteriales bacterium]|nr:hypothetical protein [Ignavibacteriales bacterium]
MKNPPDFKLPEAGRGGELHHREGGLLLRLPDRLPQVPESVPGQLPARRRVDGGDDPPGGQTGAEGMTRSITRSAEETAAAGQDVRGRAASRRRRRACSGTSGAARRRLSSGVCAGARGAPGT